jgi:two-component system phosphate regulon response regulator PhoB
MTALTARILIVEDEPAQRTILSYNLSREGYQAVEAADGDEALLIVQEQEFDLILLDWMLPGVSGIEICRRLKRGQKTKDIPVVMLSARSEDADKVRGLDTGADDYLSKPYSLPELLARVRSQLRRAGSASAIDSLSFDDITLDPLSHKVTRDSQEVHLGPTEFRLLATFLARPGRVWSREQLLSRVWQQDADVETRTVDVHVGRLRKALEIDGKSNPIRTVRGAGYALG